MRFHDTHTHTSEMYHVYGLRKHVHANRYRKFDGGNTIAAITAAAAAALINERAVQNIKIIK